MSRSPTWMPSCAKACAPKSGASSSSLGITSVYVTHDQIEAMTLSDRMVVMNQGLIEQVGTPVEVYRYPSSRFVADFIGRANFIDAVVVDGRPGDLMVKVYGQTVRLSTVQGDFLRRRRLTLIARPEMIQVGPQGDCERNGAAGAFLPGQHGRLRY